MKKQVYVIYVGEFDYTLIGIYTSFNQAEKVCKRLNKEANEIFWIRAEYLR